MSDECISPLRRRMIEDMTVRKFTLKTQSDYIRVVKNFTIFLGRSPDTASNEDLRRFQLHLSEKRVGAPTINLTVSALRFFFTVTLDRTAEDSGRSEPRGGGAFSGGRPRRQIQGGAERGLWCRPARVRGCDPEGVRHR